MPHITALNNRCRSLPCLKATLSFSHFQLRTLGQATLQHCIIATFQNRPETSSISANPMRPQIQAIRHATPTLRKLRNLEATSMLSMTCPVAAEIHVTRVQETQLHCYHTESAKKIRGCCSAPDLLPSKLPVPEACNTPKLRDALPDRCSSFKRTLSLKVVEKKNSHGELQ